MYQKNRCCWNCEDQGKELPDFMKRTAMARGKQETYDHVVDS
jgi:hypothetical protein